MGPGRPRGFFIDLVGERVARGDRFTGVPTSEASRRHALSLGIPLLGDDGPWKIAVTVDGADEVDADLNLIKGGGGAHTREKIVNFASAKNVIIVDERKLSKRLGEKWPIPIEVLPFAHLETSDSLSRFGVPTRRERDGAPVQTDSGNFIYDLKVAPIRDVHALDIQLREIPGIVETGLFAGRADVVIVAAEGGIRRLTRTPPATR